MTNDIARRAAYRFAAKAIMKSSADIEADFPASNHPNWQDVLRELTRIVEALECAGAHEAVRQPEAAGIELVQHG